MNRRIARTFFFIFLLWVAAGCTKSEDASPPSIYVYTPVNNEEFSAGDSIHVTATITHKYLLEYARITLWNNFNIPVLDPIYVYMNDYGYNLDEKYPLDDGLETGSYILVLTASDGYNSANAFRTVQVKGVDKSFERVLAVCRQNTLNTIVYGIDTSGGFQNVIELGYPYAGSDISSGQRQLFMLRPDPYVLHAYDIGDLSEDFSIEAQPPYPVFNHVSYDEPLLYLCSGNGDIRGYEMNAYPAYITPVNEDTIPMMANRQYDLVLAYCERRGGPERFIRQYYSATGVFRTSLKINFTVAGFFGLEQGSVLVFGNSGDESSIYLYDAHNNYLAGKWDMPPGNIRGVEQVASSTYLLNHDAGIFLYVHSTGALSLWQEGTDAMAMAFDHTRQLLYYAEDAVVRVRRLSDAALVQEIALPSEVLNLHIQYNR